MVLGYAANMRRVFTSCAYVGETNCPLGLKEHQGGELGRSNLVTNRRVLCTKEQSLYSYSTPLESEKVEGVGSYQSGHSCPQPPLLKGLNSKLVE